MRHAPILPVLILLATLASGCGGASSGGSSRSSSTSTVPPTSTAQARSPAARNVEAPPGASATRCPANDSGTTTLRAIALGCAEARSLARAWRRRPGCAPAPGASRSACAIRPYRCVTAVSDRGLSVSCARHGAALAFTARR